MKKSDAIRLRKQVQALAKKGLSVSAIARKLGVSRLFVRTWKDADDPAQDKRGWKEGRKRKYTDEQEQCVVDARNDADVNEDFFSERRPSHRRFRENNFRWILLKEQCANTNKRRSHRRKRKEDRSICYTPFSSFRRLERYSYRLTSSVHGSSKIMENLCIF